MSGHETFTPTRVGLIALVALGGLSATVPGLAEESPTRISGLVFADYFYNLQGGGVVEDDNGFQFRRIYLTADHDLSERIASRLTLEVDNRERTMEGGSLAAGKSAAFVKLAYLSFKNAVPGGSLLAGMSSTPLWQRSEAVWGYRSVERTSLDLRGLGSASDLGVALQGTLGEGAPIGYHVMFANGTGQRPENDRSKKVYVALPLRWRAGVLEPVVSHEGGPGDGDRQTLKVLLGWQEEGWAAGAEWFSHWFRNAGPSGADRVPIGASLFGRAKLRERLAAFVRYDWLDDDAESGDVLYRHHYALAGLDYMPIPEVHLAPNVALESYEPKSALVADRETDVVLRVTLAYQYKE